MRKNHLEKKNNAIIIGGGIAGKLIAAAISSYFDRILILEKDEQPKDPMTVRSGVSQGNHIHALLFAGANSIEKIFPGFQKDMIARGSIPIDSIKDLAWYHHGVWKIQHDSRHTTLLQTRPLLESYIEERVTEIPNIHMLYGAKVQSYLLDELGHISGALAIQKSQELALEAGLVIDTSGSSSLTKNWLQKLGKTVPEENVEIGLCYATRMFKLPVPPKDYKLKILYPTPPVERIGGTISMVEGDKYIVTLNGYLNSLEPSDIKSETGFVEMTGKLPLPDIHQELLKSESISETMIYQVPHIIWRRFDKLELPEGLLIAGDSFCRIDPVFGQGMSIAALEAIAIGDYFKGYPKEISCRKLQKKLAKIVAPVWSMVLCEDFRYKEVRGKRPFGLQFQQWYVKKLFLLSANNRMIYNDLVNVMNLVRPAATLFKPSTIKEILKKAE